MRRLLYPFRVLYVLYAMIWFGTLMLLVAPFVVAASFLGKIRGGNLIFRLCCWWGDAWYGLVGMRHKNIYESPHDRHAQFIFVANHISYLDAAILVKTMRQPIRVLGKAEMSRIPVFGFIYRNAIVTVERNSAANRARSVRILKSVVNKGISIFIFPEGTFNTTHRPLKDFYDGAFRIAIETQTPIKPVLFLDAYSRMPYESVWLLNPGRCRSVFLEPVPVVGLTLRDVEALKQRVHRIMEEKLRQYEASWIKPDAQTD